MKGRGSVGIALFMMILLGLVLVGIGEALRTSKQECAWSRVFIDAPQFSYAFSNPSSVKQAPDGTMSLVVDGVTFSVKGNYVMYGECK